MLRLKEKAFELLLFWVGMEEEESLLKWVWNDKEVKWVLNVAEVGFDK